MMTSVGSSSGASTCTVSLAKLTDARTPVSVLSARSTDATQEEQVIPVTE